MKSVSIIMNGLFGAAQTDAELRDLYSGGMVFLAWGDVSELVAVQMQSQADSRP